MAEEKPVLRLIGKDGNAFAVLGACNRVMRRAGWSKERREAVLEEMQEGDYQHLLSTAMKHFDVE